jgi:hypothetical protein
MSFGVESIKGLVYSSKWAAERLGVTQPQFSTCDSILADLEIIGKYTIYPESN